MNVIQEKKFYYLEAPNQLPAPGKLIARAQIAQLKRARMEEARANKWTFNNIVFVTGDLFTFGNLGFRAVQCLATKTQSIALVSFSSFICGEIAGAINIFVGIGCLIEAIQAWKNGTQEKQLRLAIDFLCITGIGIIMILVSLATKIAALGGIGAFFAANPWLLPLLFLIAALPVFRELCKALGNLYKNKDLGSRLQLTLIEDYLKRNDWAAIHTLIQGPHNSLNMPRNHSFELISAKMEQFQEYIGAEAAVEVFDLWQSLLEKNQEKALAQIQQAKKTLADWNWSLHVRMFQQILYIAGFFLSLGCLGVSSQRANTLDGVQSIFLAGANAIPTYMDAFWPFKRNAPIMVPLVEPQDL